MIDIYHPTFDELYALCYDIAIRVKFQLTKPDIIIGLSRGGTFPSLVISHLLNIQTIPVCYSSVSGRGDDRNHKNTLPELNDKTILILDDIIDSGFTMKEVDTYYSLRAGNRVYTAALYYKPQHPVIHIPTLYGVKLPEDAAWIKFPWETTHLYDQED